MFSEIWGKGILTSYNAFYEFFKSKNALSFETAIEPTDEELLTIGLTKGGMNLYTMPLFTKGLSPFIAMTSPIVKVGDNKYWFSEEKLNNFNKNAVKYYIMNFAIVFFMSALFLYLYLTYFQPIFSSTLFPKF